MKATSWEWVFHFCFVAGTIWFVLWQYNVYNTPEEHPRIHPSERGYILQILGSSVIRNDTKRVIPWRQILTSRCIWVQCITQVGGIWGLFTLLTQSPIYFRIIHGWSIEMTGILSGVPHLMRVLFSLTFSMFGDYLLTHNKMSRGNVRKLATFFRETLLTFTPVHGL
jgi:ACS family sodium-dependent inorganic phosphate cotransporter-like MFS transporter 5